MGALFFEHIIVIIGVDAYDTLVTPLSYLYFMLLCWIIGTSYPRSMLSEQVDRLMAPYSCRPAICMPYIDGDACIHFINWLLPLHTQIKSVSYRELLARLVRTTPVRQQYVFCLNLQPTLNTFALGFPSCMVRYIIFQLFSKAFTCNSAASKSAKIQQRVILIKKNYGR